MAREKTSMFAKARSMALGAGFLKGKPLLDRRSFRRRLALLWGFDCAWLACAAWVIFSFNAHPVWLTTTIMIALFITAPEPWLLLRTYKSYSEDWHVANDAKTDQSSAGASQESRAIQNRDHH
jgi:hypothetical protein